MTLTQSAIHRPSPLTNYMQHLQQKNNKPTVHPIKSGAMRQLQPSSSTSTSSSSLSNNGSGGGRNDDYRNQQQQHRQHQQQENNKLPVWKERQLRAQLQDSSNNSHQQHQPGSARLAMTIQTNNGSSEIRRVPFYHHENPALVDKQQHHHHHHHQQQQQHQHHQQLHDCDPITNTISGNVTYVSSSSTESEDARSSTDDSHTDRTTEEEDQDQLLVVSSSSMALVPFQQDIVEAVLEDEEINAESLYQELIVRDDGEPQETDIDALTKMIDDCAARWQNSARVPSRRSLTSIAIATSTDNANVVPVVPPLVRREEIIAQQRAEIKYLRARLASQDEDPSSDFAAAAATRNFDHHEYYPDLGVHQQHQHYHHGAAGMGMMFPPPHLSPVEQIDSVPIEHIEVAVDHDGDLCSVTSGLTNLVDLSSRMPDDATAISFLLEKSFSRRPDAESSVCSVLQQQQEAAASSQQQRRVTDQPLLLRAADGSSRQALYTGPVQCNGNDGSSITESITFTGTGVLKFVETGDLYMGQVSNGEMHGQGTYTFAKQKKRRPHKVLRGQFQNNVYVGWNPDAAFWNDNAAVAPR